MSLAPVACDRLAYVRGLDQLVPEQRLAAILSRSGRASQRRRRRPAESVVGRVIAMAFFAADSIPKVWRRRLPPAMRPSPMTRPSLKPAGGGASHRSAACSSRRPGPWPPTRPSASPTAAFG